MDWIPAFAGMTGFRVRPHSNEGDYPAFGALSAGRWNVVNFDFVFRSRPRSQAVPSAQTEAGRTRAAKVVET